MFKQHRRFPLIILVTLLALIIGAAAAVYFFRHSAVIFSANRYLHPYGLTLISISDVRIGVTEFHVGKAVVEVSGSDNKHVMHDVTVHYSPAQLAAGEIESLLVRQLTLSMPLLAMPGSATDNAGDSDQMPASLLPILQDLPVRHVRIEHLNLPGFSQSVALQLTRSIRDLQIAVNAGETQLLAAINWHDQNYVSSHFLDADHLQPETLSPDVISGRVTLTKADSQAITIDLSLQDKAEELSVEILAFFDATLTTEIGRAINNTPDNWPQLSGRLESDLAFTLTKSNLEIPMFSAVFNAGSELGLRELAGWIPAIGATEIQLQLNSDMILTGKYSDSDAMSFNIAADDAGMQLKNLPDAGDLELAVGNIHTQCQQFFLCTSTQLLHLNMASLTTDDFSLSGTSLSGVLTVDNMANGLTITAEPGLQLTIEQGSGTAFALTNAAINSSAILTLRQNSDETTLTGSNLQVTLPFIRMDEKISRATINIPSMSLSMQGGLALDMELIAIDMASELLPVNLLSTVIESQLSIRDNTLAATGELHMNGQLAVGFNISQQMETNVGNGEFRLPGIQFDSLWNKLSDFIDPLPVNIDLLSGSLTGGAEIDWMLDTTGAWQMSGPINIQLDAISGLYEEIGFVGARTELAIELLHDGKMRSLTAKTFEVASIDIGFPVENLRFDYELDALQGIYTVRNIEASIFQGGIFSQGLDYDINADSNFLLVELQQIDIANLLSLAAYEAVNATGLVSGQLPITLTGGQVTINAGNLSALAPGGEISYRPADSLAGSGQISSGNANLDLVYEALANYQYQVLQSSVDYLDTGELILSVKLEGSSPDMQSGNQRINLNLNISDNIPALLQSLQASRSIADALELRLQEQ